MPNLKHFWNNIGQSSRCKAVALLLLACISAFAAPTKRDFRGAWIQTIYQGYDKRTTAENQAYLRQLLDSLQACGINAVFFQVRPRADALYESELEPWSLQLTGAYGRVPSPYWDPLQFMIDEAHSRGMELHAWMNPYRGPATDDPIPANHMVRLQPKRFVKYGQNYIFDPSQQVNRDYICRVVADVLSRYDVDGIHFDDYFYPYPIAKEKFPDAKAYAASRTKLSLGDWRRHNVDLLIEQVHHTIDSIKPWVRFGISPFGIWRNSTSDPRGSKTRGLQNYDDLYADVPLWAEKGWIDYQIPQLYWEIGHRAAPYDVLCPWWAKNGRGRHIYIGQDAEKTADKGELDAKMAMVEAPGIQGNCWWYAAAMGRVAQGLKSKHYTTIALPPVYEWKQASPATAPMLRRDEKGYLFWNADPAARCWVVYRFKNKKSIDLQNPEAIQCVTYTPEFLAVDKGVYVVTALDCANRESAPSNVISIR